MKADIKKIIDAAAHYTIASDGWNDAAHRHLINFVILIPKQKPIFWKVVDSSLMKLDSEGTKSLIRDAAKEIGFQKWTSLIMDNAPRRAGLPKSRK